MALLEKGVHEKQDTIISLREQIDDVKKINIDLYQKLRVNFSRESEWKVSDSAFRQIFKVSEQHFKDKERILSKLQTEHDALRSHSHDKICQLETR